MRMPIMRREAMIVDGSTNADENTVDVVWTAGATVRRRKFDFFSDDAKEFDEQLVVEPKSVRLDTLNSGASFLDSHDSYGLDKVLGTIVPGSARIAGGKGFATVRLSRAAGKADTIQDIKDKIIRNISVGYRVHKTEVTQRKDGVPLHRVIDWEPLEISAVAVPADPGAHVRGGEKPELYECEFVRSADSETKPVERSHHMADSDNDTVTAPEATPVETRSNEDTQELITRALADERKRVNEIGTICARFEMPAEFRSEHIGNNTPVSKVKDLVLDAIHTRAEKGPAFSSARIEADSRDKTTAGMSEALMARASIEGGKQNEFSGLTLREMARECLRATGGDYRMADPMAMVAEALGIRTRAGMHSTSDFTNVLANVANKSLLKGFGEAEENLSWCATGSLTDFKPTKRVDLNLFPSLLSLPEGAEYQHGTVGDRGETVTLATYGRMFAITRQAIINDDMSVFSRLPSAMGRAARRTVANLAWAVITDNAALSDGVALFHTADHGNLASSGAAPTVATVDAGRVAMAKQRDPDSIAAALNIRPAYFLVPVELEGTALVLMNSEFNPANTQRVPNSVRGIMEVISEARLSINSATAWYMAANPNAADTVEISYLNGVETPVIEQQPGWNVDGVEFKVRIDAAVKALGYRGLYKNAGA
jgi:hypothetical protein